MMTFEQSERMISEGPALLRSSQFVHGIGAIALQAAVDDAGCGEVLRAVQWMVHKALIEGDREKLDELAERFKAFLRGSP